MLLTILRLVGLTAIALAVPAVAQHGDGLKLFKSEDVFELEYAADPRISPDGETIVYVRNSNDIMTDTARSNLWMIDVDTGDHRPLFSGRTNYSSPRFSADGGRLAYISEAEGSPQLYVRWIDTAQIALVSNLRRSPSAISWSPDGTQIAFTMGLPVDKKPLVTPPEKPEGAKWSEPVRIIDTLRYQRDGSGIVEEAYTHVFVVPADGGTPRQLTEGNFNHAGPLSWKPDGKEILISANRHEDWEYETIERDIWAISVASGALRQVTDEPGAEYSPATSPDGRLIAYRKASNEKVAYRNSVITVMEVDGSNVRGLTESLDRSAQNIQWAGNGRGLYFQYLDQGAMKVGYVSLSGEVRQVASDLGGVGRGRPYSSGTYRVASDGTIVYTRGTSQRPADIAVRSRGNTRTLTALNDDLLGDRALGEVHEIIYKSSLDGTQIQGWYVTPPGFDPAKKYSLILEIHGGPHSAYGPNFTAEIQRYAAEGYVVFYDNYRGSTGYGKDFALLLQYKYASKDDFADHMSGVDAMIGLGFIDEENLFITGGSAGGVGSAYAIGLTDRFRAAAVAKPVVNWISKTLTADSYVGQIALQFPGMPWEEFDHYWQRSPLSLVGNVVTPTLLITGEADRRTPISETEQFYQALKLRKIDSVMVRVPDSPHGIAGRPSRLIAKVDHIIAWFEKYRKR